MFYCDFVLVTVAVEVCKKIEEKEGKIDVSKFF